MAELENTVVRIARAPAGLPTLDDFDIVREPVPDPGPGEVLFRSLYMSLDPAMRRRMPSPVPTPGPNGGQASVGDPMMAGGPGLHYGGHVGEVVASNHPDFRPGDVVKGGLHWQVYHTARGDRLLKLDLSEAGLRDELGPLGVAAFTAYAGMRTIAEVRPGETFVVSAAGGAVGMIAGQMARIAGARAVGIASGDKCDYVVRELGFDACVDRNAGPIGEALDKACPDGIDAYFDNAGGEALSACYDRMANFGRLVLCGMVAEYNAPESDIGPPLRPALRKRLKIQGLVVFDHEKTLRAEFRRQMLDWLHEGQIRYRYDVADGIENAPAALIGVLEGKNRGKMLVRVGEG